MTPTMTRLYQAIAYLTGKSEVGPTDAAQFLGLPNSQTVKNWESRGPSNEGMVAIALKGVSLGWLQTGSGPMLPSLANVEPGPSLRGGDVPLISWVQAGTFCEAIDTYTVGDAEKWLVCPVPHSESTFALRVRGDSMTAFGGGRSYPEGSIIFIDPERRSPTNGDRIVACLEDSPTHEVTFKVFKDEDGKKWLMPLNPMHSPIRDKFRVLGTVIGQWIDD